LSIKNSLQLATFFKPIYSNFMEKKINLAILFGGKSAEHEISIKSATNIARAANKDKYQIMLIGIEKNGEWYLHNPELLDQCGDTPVILENISAKKRISILPGNNLQQSVLFTDTPLHVDIIFPVLHGTCGEDGTVQGLLKLLNIPFVGADVLGSAVGMDKDVMKRLLREKKIAIPQFLVFNIKDTIEFSKVSKTLGLPLFVKPCNLGSSVGISKVTHEDQFLAAVTEAFLYDTKIIIEESIIGREIECSVLGNLEPVVSLPGEILTKDTFYSYKAKYIDDQATDLKMPAEFPPATINRIGKIAIASYKALCCSGLARMDFFVTHDNRVLVNEINTLPGFTNISMYPKLWELEKIQAPELIDKLINLGLEKFNTEQLLKTNFV